MYRKTILLTLLLSSINAQSDAEDDTTPPSNVTAGSLTRGANDVWGSAVSIGPSKKYLECKKLLEKDLNKKTPCPVTKISSGGGYHLPAVTTPSQGYARAAGMMLFVASFMIVVGILKLFTGNVLKHWQTSFATALVVLYSEVSVFAIIGLIGFIVLRLDALPQYSATFLPGQSTDTMTVMFENVEMTMFFFIVFYAMFGMALIKIGMNISSTWSIYELRAGNRCGEEQEHLKQASLKTTDIKNKIHKESNISYLCLRDDFVRNSPSRHGLRGPNNAPQFDFSRYLTLQLSAQLAGILKMTFPQWLILFISAMMASLASAFPLALQLVIGQFFSWSLVVLAVLTYQKVKESDQFLNRGLNGRNSDHSETMTSEETEKTSLINNPYFNKMLTFEEIGQNKIIKDNSANVMCGMKTRQDGYFCCGSRGGSYMRGIQRGLLLGTALVAALQVQLCVRASHVSYGWALGILAILAMSITIHFLGLILLHFTLMVSVEFQRNTEYVDQVIEEQSQLLTQSSALYLVYLACEYKELTFEHVMKSGRATLTRAQNELEGHCVSGDNDAERPDSYSTYDKLMRYGVQALVTDKDIDSDQENIRQLKQLLKWFDINFVDEALCKTLLKTSESIDKTRVMEDHFKFALELILELTSPDSNLPLLLMSKKLINFTRAQFFLKMLTKRELNNDKDKKDFIKEAKDSMKTSYDLKNVEEWILETDEYKNLNHEAKINYQTALDKAKSASTHMLECFWPLLGTTETSAGINRSDSRLLIPAMKLQTKSNLDAKPLGFEKLARLIASRAQVIQSKWQQAYPQMKDEQGRPISATIASLARAMSVTAIGASGAVVVALAGNPPERREENEGESDDEEGTKE